jgi:Lon protease-like protein
MDGNEELLRIPIFPLENVVLFPRVQVPLHIFEPRYRQMTRAALDGGRRIGMVVVRPDATSGMPGNPPVFSIGCAGDIQRADELPGGRFNLVLSGTARFEIVEEEPPTGEHRRLVLALRGEVHELMRQLLAIVAPGRVEMFEQQPIVKVDDEAFVNAMAQSIDFSPPEKQALIESEGIRERFERLADFMRFRLAELSSGGSPGPGIVQ